MGYVLGKLLLLQGFLLALRSHPIIYLSTIRHKDLLLGSFITRAMSVKRVASSNTLIEEMW